MYFGSSPGGRSTFWKPSWALTEFAGQYSIVGRKRYWPDDICE